MFKYAYENNAFELETLVATSSCIINTHNHAYANQFNYCTRSRHCALTTTAFNSEMQSLHFLTVNPANSAPADRKGSRSGRKLRCFIANLIIMVLSSLRGNVFLCVDCSRNRKINFVIFTLLCVRFEMHVSRTLESRIENAFESLSRITIWCRLNLKDIQLRFIDSRCCFIQWHYFHKIWYLNFQQFIANIVNFYFMQNNIIICKYCTVNIFYWVIEFNEKTQTMQIHNEMQQW